MFPWQVTFLYVTGPHSLMSWTAGISGKNVTVISSVMLIMHPLLLDAQYGTVEETEKKKK